MTSAPNTTALAAPVQPFNFDGELVRVVTDEHGAPWFALADLCAVLGIGNSRMVAARLAEDEKGVRRADTPGGRQHITFVNEPGLWSVILRSDSPAAEPVRRWVTHEVLPTIRRSGRYSSAAQVTRADLARMVLDAEAQLEQAHRQLEADRPKVLFADAVATSRTDILVGDLAKILKGNGVDVGGTRLFEWLRRDGYLIRRHGSDRNMPTQRSMELGLFRVKESVVTHADGHSSVSRTPKVTGKGQTYFINRYASELEPRP